MIVEPLLLRKVIVVVRLRHRFLDCDSPRKRSGRRSRLSVPVRLTRLELGLMLLLLLRLLVLHLLLLRLLVLMHLMLMRLLVLLLRLLLRWLIFLTSRGRSTDVSPISRLRALHLHRNLRHLRLSIVNRRSLRVALLIRHLRTRWLIRGRLRERRGRVLPPRWLGLLPDLTHLSRRCLTVGWLLIRPTVRGWLRLIVR